MPSPRFTLLAALAVLFLLAGPAGASAGQAAASVLSHPLPAAGSGGFSPAEMRSAPPRDVLRLPAPAALGGPSPRSGSRTASTGSSSPRPERTVAGRPPRGAAPAADVFAPLRARSFSSGRVATPTTYPNSTWGRLFGEIPGIGAYSCSATVVRSRNRSVIYTAGHCVRDPAAGWARRLAFVPAFTSGRRPFGLWVGKVALVDPEWARFGNPNYDYAAVVLRRREGRRIEDSTGSLGLSFNARKRRRYRAVGYPANKARGERMWECHSRFRGVDPFYRRPGPKPIGIGCDMRGGASGGGWSTERNELVSLTSFGYTSRKDRLYGPRFSRRAEKLRRSAQRR